jgi:hypothetical protein
MDGHLVAVLQAVTVAVLVWFGSKVQHLAESVAVHEERHRRHDARLEKLEEKIC